MVTEITTDPTYKEEKNLAVNTREREYFFVVDDFGDFVKLASMVYAASLEMQKTKYDQPLFKLPSVEVV